MDRPLYLQPSKVEDALEALAARPLAVLAGGTDFYPARVGRLVREDVLDVSRVGGLRGMREEAGSWRIGALTTWTDVVRQPLPPLFDGLKLAAREIGGLQIQNAATLAGNLCNASPAADGVPALVALSAQVELASARGRRTLALAEFITGNRTTQRRPDELLTAIVVPVHGTAARSTFLKLGARRYLVISIAMAALTLDFDDQARVVRAGIAVGACSPLAQRIPGLEARLLGARRGPELADLVRPQDFGVLSPVSDVRGTAEYRLDAVQTLVRRGLAGLAYE